MVPEASRRRVYRQLLRAAAASTRFARPATRSLRKLIREDVENTELSPVAAERTMTFFLLSALYQRPVAQPERKEGPPWRPSNFSEAAHLAHSCVANLASLTYHHLSPNTAMQSKRVGGSSSSTAPRKQSVVSEAFSEMDAGPSDAAANINLNVLQVQPKPIRGPVGSKPVYWDAQHPEKHLAAVRNHAEMDTLQERLNVLAAQYADLVEQHGADHKLSQAARAKLVDLRGSLKGMRKAVAKSAADQAFAQVPKDALYDVVNGLADSAQVCVGLPRWTRWRRGDYLAP